MNITILQKCVEELKKETFSKEYVLGMLEAIIQMTPTQTYVPNLITNQGPITNYTQHSEAMSGEDVPAFLRPN